jgi:hypothetical protein
MITLRQEEKLIERIQSLSELELSSLLKEVSIHIRNNKLDHLVDSTFESEARHSLEVTENELIDANNRITELSDEVADLRIKIKKIKELL